MPSVGDLQGFVDRHDVLIDSLTVREMLYYSAHLQLPGLFSSKTSIVEDAIAAMSLADYADNLIGGHCFINSLPAGERRRLSIARELVMRPHVLFIDEPLYHLDRFVSLPFHRDQSNYCCFLSSRIFVYHNPKKKFASFNYFCMHENVWLSHAR